MVMVPQWRLVPRLCSDMCHSRITVKKDSCWHVAYRYSISSWLMLREVAVHCFGSAGTESHLHWRWLKTLTANLNLLLKDFHHTLAPSYRPKSSQLSSSSYFRATLWNNHFISALRSKTKCTFFSNRLFYVCPFGVLSCCSIFLSLLIMLSL